MRQQRDAETHPKSSIIDDAANSDAAMLMEAIANELLAKIACLPKIDGDPLLPASGKAHSAFADAAATPLAETEISSQTTPWSRAEAVEKIEVQMSAAGQALQALWDEPPPLLESFNLSVKEGRRGFLWSLFMDHYEHGLFLAVQHVWTSLAEPKAVRCTLMAQLAKLPGVGRTALKNVLAEYLDETLYRVDFPPLPDKEGYSDFNAWSEACQKESWDVVTAQFEEIVSRYEAILDGRKPNVPADNVIAGPWVS